jgi:putative lipoic acid-binding regulatory protein
MFKLSFTYFLLLLLGTTSGFLHFDCTGCRFCRISHHHLPPPATTITTASSLSNSAISHNNESGNGDDGNDAHNNSSSPTTETWEDLPERFKYQVQALMGNFDPVDPTVDDERQNGNILRALLPFPTQYTFYVVGKTLGDTVLEREYTDHVQRIVQETTGDEDLYCESIARGKNFTKVQCMAIVQSATMVNNIYDELDGLEQTVMRF